MDNNNVENVIVLVITVALRTRKITLKVLCLQLLPGEPQNPVCIDTPLKILGEGNFFLRNGPPGGDE